MSATMLVEPMSLRDVKLKTRPVVKPMHE